MDLRGEPSEPSRCQAHAPGSFRTCYRTPPLNRASGGFHCCGISVSASSFIVINPLANILLTPIVCSQLREV